MLECVRKLLQPKVTVTVSLAGRPHYRGLGICGRCGRKATGRCCPIQKIPLS